MALRLIICALALVLAGCTAVPSSSPSPSVPVIAQAGMTNVFGLMLDLKPNMWKQAAVKSTQAEFWIDYTQDGQVCQGQCPSLLIATAESQYYRLSTKRSGTVFATETECAQGASAFDAAQEQESGIKVGGREVQYFVNPRCLQFQQASDGSSRRHSWFLPTEGFLIQLLPGTSSTILAQVQDVLRRAQWVGR